MQNNILTIIIPVLLAAALSALLILRRHKNTALEAFIRAILPALTNEAEKLFGDGTGQIKLSWVIDQVYQRLPEQLASRVGAEQIERLVDAALKKLRPLWEEIPRALSSTGESLNLIGFTLPDELGAEEADDE